MHECALNHCDETKDEVLQGMSPVTMRTAEMAIHMRCPAENILFTPIPWFSRQKRRWSGFKVSVTTIIIN